MTLSWLISALTYRVKIVGKAPICNCRRERGPIIFGFSFPLCWRCTSIIAPFLVLKWIFRGSVEFQSMLMSHTPQLIALGILLMFPTFIDGVMQYGYRQESTNFRRIVTGVPAGVGLYLVRGVLSVLIP